MSHRAADTLWDRFVGPLLAFPADLAAVVLFVALVDSVVLLPAVHGTPLAVAIRLPLLVFAPGYALVSLLFPGSGPDDVPAFVPRPKRTVGLDGIERVALGFGVSVALLPVLGVVLSLLPVAITPDSVLASVSLTAGVGVVAAAVRRGRLPSDRRFSVPVRTAVSNLVRDVFDAETRLDLLVNVALATAVLLALTSMGYALTVPGDGEQFTEFSLLGERQDGELVAAGYPTNVTVGESEPVFLRLENHEGETVAYTVAVKLQRVRQAKNGGAAVLQEETLARFTPRVAAGETWQTRHDVAPTMTGENLRLVYLLYTDDVPANPTVQNADQYTHIWINVTE